MMQSRFFWPGKYFMVLCLDENIMIEPNVSVENWRIKSSNLFKMCVSCLFAA